MNVARTFSLFALLGCCSIPGSLSAQELKCDSVRPLLGSISAYKNRGNRCEGLYVADVGSRSIDIVSFRSGSYCAKSQITIALKYLSIAPSQLRQQHCTGRNGPETPEVKRQTIMDSLRELAVDQIRSDDAFLGKRRFTIDQQSHTLSYDLRPTPVSFVLSEADPDALALEALIRVEALRRDFTESISAEKFWSVLLDAIQQSIGRCVQFSELELQSGSHPCNKEIETKFEQLRRAIESYATEHGLRLIEASQARGPVVGYRMGIKIDPPKARVRIMTLLEYKKYKYFKTPPDEYQWSDLLESEANMIGWYHYRAEWPSELNGPEEGDIEIKQAGTVTFRPNPK